MLYTLVAIILLLGVSMAEARGGHGHGHGRGHGHCCAGHSGSRHFIKLPLTERDQKPTIELGYIDPRVQTIQERANAIFRR